ncbi:MAG: DUF1499 domain-containing protein [Parvibaculaceae bacterium]|nr:DUF1499 domain-containing protein [Parvibaculaceae bacterium]
MKKRSGILRLGFRLALLAIVLAVLAILGHRLGVMDFQLAVFGMAAAGGTGLLSVLVTMVGIVKTTINKGPGLGFGLASMIMALVVALPIVIAVDAGRTTPFIHDISTDLTNPPEFVAIVAARGNRKFNSLERTAEVGELQQAGYPELGGLFVDRLAGQVFEVALATAQAQGWTIVAVSPETGLIEASATTLVLNFTDDVVIRVADVDGKAMVDVRSASRVGRSDMGANAKRIKAYLAALTDALANEG